MTGQEFIDYILDHEQMPAEVPSEQCIAESIIYLEMVKHVYYSMRGFTPTKKIILETKIKKCQLIIEYLIS